MLWRNENELKLHNHNQTYEDRYKEVEGDILLNIKRQAYLDIDYEALENLKFAQSDEEENNVDCSMTNPDFLDLHLEDIDSLKLVSAIFYQVFIFHKMIILQKL